MSETFTIYFKTLKWKSVFSVVTNLLKKKRKTVQRKKNNLSKEIVLRYKLQTIALGDSLLS